MINIVHLIIAVFLFSAPNIRSQDKIEPDEIIKFKQTPQGDLKFHIFYPEGKKPDSAPAILYFFGGGWIGGSPSQFYPQSVHFAKKGVIGICAEYRVKNKHKTDPFTCVEDGLSALSEIQKNHARYGVNPHKIVVAGGSAGGHVAACSVLVKPESKEEGKKLLPMPAGLILYNPVCDTSSEGYGHTRLGDRWMEISPAHLIHDKVPPTLILHGTIDKTVPFANAINFQIEMRKKKRICKVAAFPGQNHAFFNFGRPSYEDVMVETEAFLKELSIVSEK